MNRNIFLLKDVNTTQTGTTHPTTHRHKTYQAYGMTSSGTGACSVDIEVSNDNVNWQVAGTIALILGTSVVSDGFYDPSTWNYVHAKLNSISGTGATISVTMGN